MAIAAVAARAIAAVAARAIAAVAARTIVPVAALAIGAVAILAGPARGQRPASVAPSTANPPGVTTLVILGVDHSSQLVSRGYHPGYLRAFFDRVKPAALCIERSPDEFARGDYYEFTYEVQHIAVPYARSKGIDLCPVDWLPSRDDERLAFGRLEVVDPSAVRAANGFQGFLVLDSTSSRRTLFYADSEANRAEVARFYDRPRVAGWPDFPRRLGMYRTFMQAMRVRAALRAHPGETLLVVIGSMHKDDIEQILSGDPGLRIVQPSTFGMPEAAERDARLSTADLAAILSFNLLGVQGSEGPVDWEWVRDVLSRFARAQPQSPELALFRLRFASLVDHAAPSVSGDAYERLAARTDTSARFTFTGVEDTRRLDSYFDPFGNLTIGARALVEAAREWAHAGDKERASALRRRLLQHGIWTPLRRAQLAEYWERYIVPE